MAEDVIARRLVRQPLAFDDAERLPDTRPCPFGVDARYSPFYPRNIDVTDPRSDRVTPHSTLT
jgi:hypothetical protein